MIELTKSSISIVVSTAHWPGPCLRIPLFVEGEETQACEDDGQFSQLEKTKKRARDRINFYTKRAWKMLHLHLYNTNRATDIIEFVTSTEVDSTKVRSNLPYYAPDFEFSSFEYSRMKTSDAARAFNFWRDPTLMDRTILAGQCWTAPKWHDDVNAISAMYWTVWLRFLSIGKQL